MKKIKIFSNSYINFSIVLILGIFLGGRFFSQEHKSTEQTLQSDGVTQTNVWTCSMHPSIRMEKPGKCPLCAMDLIPLTMNAGEFSDPESIHLTPEAAKLAEVQTTMVSKNLHVSEIRLYGKVQPDERLLQSQSAHIAGRIERLNVNFTGETVKKGQVLAVIYSPELITAQQELIETAAGKQSRPELYEAAKEKLTRWKIPAEQIGFIEKSGKPVTNFEITSNTSGIVMERRVNTGDYISAGTVLFEVADLSTVWIVFEAYESDLQFLKKGDKVSFTIHAMPGNEYSGRIIFIDPVIDPVTRVARIRVEAANHLGKLKPEMFVNGIVQSATEQFPDNITIPRSSVLWTGKRSLVYVKQPGTTEQVFKVREIGIGPLSGDNYVVTDGLSEGEEIVTNGTFSVDASAQLEGKPSMMNIALSENRNFKHTSFRVEGNCEMCKDRIEKAALSVAGVKEAVWNIKTDELALAYDNTKTSLLEIHRAVAATGHDTSLLKADDNVYKALPECCLYRK